MVRQDSCRWSLESSECLAQMSSSMDRRPARLRILLVGPEASGKSCLVKRYCEKRFVSKHLATVGIDYGATRIYIDGLEPVSVHIFDTSGNPLFREVRNEFYRDAHGILIVYDASRRPSFDSLPRWLNEVRTHMPEVRCGGQASRTNQPAFNPVIMVCANKVDLRDPEAPQVDDLEARLWADLHGLLYCETSANRGTGVGDMFNVFFTSILNNFRHSLWLPETPSSARKVVVASAAASRNRKHSREDRNGYQRSKDLPTPEQLDVMVRIREAKTPWEQMGLDAGSGPDEINRSYRRLAVLLHPDKTGVRGADEAFKALGSARRQLLQVVSGPPG